MRKALKKKKSHTNMVQELLSLLINNGTSRIPSQMLKVLKIFVCLHKTFKRPAHISLPSFLCNLHYKVMEIPAMITASCQQATKTG